MREWSDRRVLEAAKRIVIGLACVAIVLQWVNSRIAILRENQGRPQPMIFSTFPMFQSMAMGMREGRIGQVDLMAVQQYGSKNDLSATFERPPRDAPHQWANYYTLDVGYSFLVEAARLAFPTLPDNHLRALALQLLADAALVPFVFFVFSHWNLWFGLAAAYLYTWNFPAAELVSFAYYYYWDVPLAFVVFGCLVIALRTQSIGALGVVGAALGFGTWLRASWWPISLTLLAVALWFPELRKRLAVPIVVFTIVAAPQVLRSSIARGTLALTTRASWHVAVVGLGYYPNPYGLALKDEAVFRITRDKYGVVFRVDDYAAHDAAAKREFFSIWSRDPRFVLESLAGRLTASLAGSTESSVPSFTFMSNVAYRLLCGAGLIAMILRGGDKRLLGCAAAAAYAVYVVLTSFFFYVGLAYDNVSQVTLFILAIGGVEAAVYALQPAGLPAAPSIPAAT